LSFPRTSFFYFCGILCFIIILCDIDILYKIQYVKLFFNFLTFFRRLVILSQTKDRDKFGKTMAKECPIPNGVVPGKKPVMELARDMGLMHVTMIGVGAMIGAGIFVLTGLAAGVSGPALLLVFALNGLVTGLTAMSYAASPKPVAATFGSKKPFPSPTDSFRAGSAGSPMRWPAAFMPWPSAHLALTFST
jgi:hypothetical protein